MVTKLHEKVLEAIGQRGVWEEKQRTWYEMRHDGIPRQVKPFPSASNMHYPLIDTDIEKLKPFYWKQSLATDRIAQFVSRDSQAASATDAAASVFDWIIRHSTNFFEAELMMMDTMLMRGKGIIKVSRDPYKNRLQFESVDPVYMVVPQNALDLDVADWFCHIRFVSIGDYHRDRRYDQDPDFVKRIVGGQTTNQVDHQDTKSRREGLTFTSNPDTVVVWDIYERTTAGWTVHVISPSQPSRYLRRPFKVTFRHASTGEAFQPFTEFHLELKDAGFYAPRGIAERLAPFEQGLNRQWNDKQDNMSFLNKPLFTSGKSIVNTGNFKFGPGDILPDGVEPVTMPQPPISIDQEMVTLHRVAEESINLPDASIGSIQESRERATATEISYRSALATTGVDLRGFIFRLALAKVYRKAWSIIVANDIDGVSAMVEGQRVILPEQARHDNYVVQPDGAVDSWWKQGRIQRSVMRFQLLRGHPNVDQAGLVKELLEAEDANLVKKLFMPDGMRPSVEAEDEAMEILVLMSGFPAVALPHEDHLTRIHILMSKLEQLGQLGAQVDPIARQRIQEHLAVHVQMLQEVNPNVARQVIGKLAGLETGQPQAPTALGAQSSFGPKPLESVQSLGAPMESPPTPTMPTPPQGPGL